MKTTKIFSVLSFALIFATATSSFSGVPENKNNQVTANSLVRYHVNVILSSEKPLCNIWLVEILDEGGRLVAPAKPYESGVTGYDFFERGPVSGKRVAVLVKNLFGDRYICATERFTNPAILFGPFCAGKTYRFDLFPTSQAQKN